MLPSGFDFESAVGHAQEARRSARLPDARGGDGGGSADHGARGRHLPLIGWVRLVITHIARMIVGTNFESLLPTAMMMGAAYLVLSKRSRARR